MNSLRLSNERGKRIINVLFLLSPSFSFFSFLIQVRYFSINEFNTVTQENKEWAIASYLMSNHNFSSVVAVGVQKYVQSSLLSVPFLFLSSSSFFIRH